MKTQDTLDVSTNRQLSGPPKVNIKSKTLGPMTSAQKADAMTKFEGSQTRTPAGATTGQTKTTCLQLG
ncbi:hypothetical protein MTO96_007419 [Rhipicephalus appendiculatus]